MISPVLSQLPQDRTLGRLSPSLNFISQKKPFLFLPCTEMIPGGKAPAAGRLVFPQICRPKRKPKINMRKTARINLAACAEKLGVLIGLSHIVFLIFYLSRKIPANEGKGESWERQQIWARVISLTLRLCCKHVWNELWRAINKSTISLVNHIPGHEPSLEFLLIY